MYPLLLLFWPWPSQFLALTFIIFSFWSSQIQNSRCHRQKNSTHPDPCFRLSFLWFCSSHLKDGGGSIISDFIPAIKSSQHPLNLLTRRDLQKEDQTMTVCIHNDHQEVPNFRKSQSTPHKQGHCTQQNSMNKNRSSLQVTLCYEWLNFRRCTNHPRVRTEMPECSIKPQRKILWLSHHRQMHGFHR